MDDLISRKALLAAYDRVHIGEPGMARKLMEDAPTVDAVEVVHGRWKYGTRSAVCSECGFERHLDDNFGAAIACPNCGAKMDGDGNG